MSYFGQPNIGSNTDGTPSDNYDAELFQAPQTGYINKIFFYAKPLIADTTCHIKCGIYADNSGSPGTLLGTTGEVTTVGNDFTWYEFTFSIPVAVTAGSWYWLADITDTDAAWNWGYGITNGHQYGGDTYSDGFADPCNGGDTAAEQMAIYAQYQESSSVHIATSRLMMGLGW